MSKQSEYVINCVKRRKHNLKSIFGLKCCICGFDKFEEALDFHHVNPNEKEFSISSSGTYSKALETQLEEAQKCILVCANCHRGIHAGLIEIPDNWQSFYNKEIANVLLEEKQQLRNHTIKHCQRCGKIISNKATYCNECSHLLSRIADRPSREELKDMIRTIPFTHIAAKYNVSDNAVKKWCDAEKLPRKKSEINQLSDKEWLLI